MESGAGALRSFRLTARGALRWYAACCDAPLACTPLKPRLVHVGLDAERIAPGTDLGRVEVETFLPDGRGGIRHKGAGPMVARMAARMLAANLSGTWRETPFFDAGGAPVAPPRILSAEARAAALATLRHAGGSTVRPAAPSRSSAPPSTGGR
jgi:hypothetical protein